MFKCLRKITSFYNLKPISKILFVYIITEDFYYINCIKTAQINQCTICSLFFQSCLSLFRKKQKYNISNVLKTICLYHDLFVISNRDLSLTSGSRKITTTFLIYFIFRPDAFRYLDAKISRKNTFRTTFAPTFSLHHNRSTTIKITFQRNNHRFLFVRQKKVEKPGTFSEIIIIYIDKL